MSEETLEKEFAIDDVYKMYQVKVTDKRGRSMNLISQVGGGEITGEQLGALFERTNSFPGAAEIEICPTNTIVPRELISKQAEMLKAGKGRPLFTPRAKIGRPIIKMPVERVIGVPDAQVPPAEGPETVDNITVTPEKGKKR